MGNPFLHTRIDLGNCGSNAECGVTKKLSAEGKYIKGPQSFTDYKPSWNKRLVNTSNITILMKRVAM